jgi:hypothetical protein
MSRPIFAFCFIIAAIVSGCAPMQRAQMQDRRAAVEVEAAACGQKFKSGEFKTHVEAETCVNDAYTRGISAGLYPYPDIRLEWEAARLRVADQLNRHEITETEAKARFLEISATATAEAQRRNADNAQAGSVIRANNAAAAAFYGDMISTGVGMMQGK